MYKVTFAGKIHRISAATPSQAARTIAPDAVRDDRHAESYYVVVEYRNKNFYFQKGKN